MGTTRSTFPPKHTINPRPKELLRRACATLTGAALRCASRDYRPPPTAALVVAPHPDDETLGCGGLIAAKCLAGQRVQVAFVTDGAASHPGHPALPPAELARRRRAEALAALAALGAAPGSAHFLDAADGSLDRLGAAEVRGIEDRLAELIRRFQPAEVFAPYRGDGSSEHAVVWRCAVAALAAAGGGTLMEYPVWAWWNASRLWPRLRRRRGNLRFVLGPLRAVKIRALGCHRSQVVAAPPWPNPVLPPNVARAGCGPVEFFFSSRIPPGEAVG